MKLEIEIDEGYIAELMSKEIARRIDVKEEWICFVI